MVKTAIIAALLSAGCVREYANAGQILMETSMGFPVFSVNENVTTSTSSSVAISTAVGPDEYVRIVCTTNTYTDVGGTPVATNQDLIIASGETTFFYFLNSSKLAFLAVSAAGTCSITPMFTD